MTNDPTSIAKSDAEDAEWGTDRLAFQEAVRLGTSCSVWG